jgi:hypothetical protein
MNEREGAPTNAGLLNSAVRACNSRTERTFDCMPPRPARDLPVRSGPLPSLIPSKAMVRMRFASGSARGSALYTPSTLDMSMSRSDPEAADNSDAKQSLSLREMLPTSLAPGVTRVVTRNSRAQSQE